MAAEVQGWGQVSPQDAKAPRKASGLAVVPNHINSARTRVCLKAW
jgi:hypothetical protein